MKGAKGMQGVAGPKVNMHAAVDRSLFDSV